MAHSQIGLFKMILKITKKSDESVIAAILITCIKFYIHENFCQIVGKSPTPEGHSLMYFYHVVKPHTYLKQSRIINYDIDKPGGLREGHISPQIRPGPELGQESRALI